MKLRYDEANHAYWLSAADSGRMLRCKGVTTVAGYPDDKWALDQWSKRTIIQGLAIEPALLEQAKKNPDDRDTLQTIAERALGAARAHDKADRGTQLHHILEAHDLGALEQVTSLVTPTEARAARAGWDKALKEAKITLDEDHIERILVYPAQRIAGRMDRFVQVGRAKSRTVLDLKTGKIDYPHKIAIQLAAYANATQMAGVLDADGVTEEFTDLPDMDRKWALIAHMPNPGEIDIVKIDIAAGWKAFQEICLKTIDWRANKSLVKPFVSVEIEDPQGPASDDEIAGIKKRLRLIAQHTEAAKRTTVMRWPNGVAQPKDAATWTAADVDRLDDVISSVEQDCEVPF